MFIQSRELYIQYTVLVSFTGIWQVLPHPFEQHFKFSSQVSSVVHKSTQISAAPGETDGQLPVFTETHILNVKEAANKKRNIFLTNIKIK